VSDEYGPWQPLPLQRLQDLFDKAPFRWWLTGGLALEQFAGTSWRKHGDIDIGICRDDAPLVHRWLIQRDQHLWIAADGQLAHWDGRALDEEADENNVWVKASPDGPWVLDIQVGDGDNSVWTYRRDKTVQREWATVVLVSADGVPYMSPEIQLLFKSKGLRPRDNEDAQRVIPRLSDNQRLWLHTRLPADHDWLELL
jgi:hypothetical protein